MARIGRGFPNRPWIFRNPAPGAGNATPSDSNTGSGTEGAPVLAVTLSDSNTGSGLEGTPTLVVAVSSSDTGSGTEGTPSISVPVASADVGAGTEGTPALAVTLSDSNGMPTAAKQLRATLTAMTGANTFTILAAGTEA